MNKKSLKIFLLERDVNILHGLEARLRVSGLEVETDAFLDNIDALRKKIKHFIPDFVFVGLRPADLDFLSNLKNDHDLSLVPFFAFFDSGDKNMISQGERVGAEYCFLSQELTIDEIASKIIKISTRKK